MAIKTLAQLRAEAQIIKNEVGVGANTAVRVGGLLDDALDSMPFVAGHHWEFNLDSEFTLAAKKSITGGVRTLMTIDGLLGYETSDASFKFWDTATDKISPLVLGDFLNIRFAITGSSDSAPINRFEIEFDVGGVGGVIAAKTLVFAKGAGNTQSFDLNIALFVGQDFFDNGGQLYITPESDASFWETAVTINRTFTPVT